MMNEYKKAVLMKGLEALNDYDFRMLKSLLAQKLNLTGKMQEDYDRIKIADLMEKKYPRDSGLDEMIAFCKDLPSLRELAGVLRKERLRISIKMKSNEKRKNPEKRGKQAGPGAGQPTPTTPEEVVPGPSGVVPTSKKRKVTKTEVSERMELRPGQNQLPETSAASTQQTEGHLQAPDLPPAAPGGSSERKKKVRKTNNLERMQDSPGQSELPGTSTASIQHTEGRPQAPYLPPPAPSGGSEKKKVTKTNNSEGMKLPPGQIQLPGASAVSIQHSEGRPQVPYLPSAALCGDYEKKKNVTKTNNLERMQLFQGQSELPGTSAATIQHTEGRPQTPCQPPAAPVGGSARRPRRRIIPTEPSREVGYQRSPKKVMVLKATEPFMYGTQDGERMMFHATVATETEFFRVKVFDISLGDKFTRGKVITLSDYIGRNGFLEIFGASSVSDVNDDRKLRISSTLVANAKATPKIIDLCCQGQGKFVNGRFLVHKKTVRGDFIFYEIQDDTGKMEVVVYGHLTRVSCEEGDKLQLFCFQVALDLGKWQLRSGIHSYIKVIKARKSKTEATNHGPNMGTSPPPNHGPNMGTSRNHVPNMGTSPPPNHGPNLGTSHNHGPNMGTSCNHGPNMGTSPPPNHGPNLGTSRPPNCGPNMGTSPLPSRGPNMGTSRQFFFPNPEY